MKLSIDRFEGDYAVCEGDDQRIFAIEVAELPRDARPGDVLDVSPEGALRVDYEETTQRKARIKGLQDKLFGKS